MKKFIIMVCATIALLASANIAEAQVVKNGKTGVEINSIANLINN